MFFLETSLMQKNNPEVKLQGYSVGAHGFEPGTLCL